jgi:autotransporter-associated beta strand protein
MGTLVIPNSIVVGPINISVKAGILSLIGTKSQLEGIGSVSVQGGILNCPNCPSLGDFGIDEGSANFGIQDVIFNSLILAPNVTLSAASISVIGASSLGGSIIATSGDINFGGAVTLVSETTITTTNRNVTFGSTVDGFSGLTIHAGSGIATFNGDIGSTTAIANLTVNALGGIFIKNITIMGLSNGLYFEKFRGNFNSNMQWFNTAQPVDINGSYREEMPASSTDPITVINNGTVKTATSTQIYICPSTDCDSNYAVRVTGYFIAPSTGTYTFSDYADDGHFMFIGNAGETISAFMTRVQGTSAYPDASRGLVVNAPGCCQVLTGTALLNAGQRYPIYSVFNEGGGGDYLWAKFQLPNGTWVSGTNGYVSNGLGYYFSIPNGNSGGGSSSGGVTLTGPVTLTGDASISSSSSPVTITGSVSSDSTPRSLTINAQTFNAQALTSLSGLSVTVADASAITGIISGNMNFTKAGDGLLALSGANTFKGTSTVNGGTLRLSNDSSLGVSTSNLLPPILTLSAGTLDLVDDIDLLLTTLTMSNSNSSIINSSGTSSLNVLNASSLRGSITTQGTQTYSGAITLSGNMTFASSDSNITFNSSITGPYDLSINSGTGTTRFIGA